jgi:hypothetical protein
MFFFSLELNVSHKRARARSNLITAHIRARVLFVAITLDMSTIQRQDIDSGSLTAVLASNRRLNVPPAAVLTLNLLVVFAVFVTFPIHLYPALQATPSLSVAPSPLMS